ncbi:hypothetical protein QWA_04847 [Alcaligenes faecalis subsp. faecalis NCIB 8687]|nr:hypothetical protein QWA_04847 [Alcaligenes faecalis subsp. faecalis NCIB 8687]
MRRLGAFVYAVLASALAWTMHSWQVPWIVALLASALWAYFLYACYRPVWSQRATLAHHAGLYSLQDAKAVEQRVQVEQLWCSAWFMTLRLRSVPPGKGCRIVTVWRSAQPPQAWWALCLCAKRLSHQVRAQNKDS